MSNIKISIVMSVYNAASYIKDSIESILSQNFTTFEFIIVDDGSIDSSLKIIQSYDDKRIRLISQENTGLAKALNIGIEKSKSNLIARMDADDIALPGRLQKQYDFLTKNLNYIVVGSNADFIDKIGTYIFTSSLAIGDKEAKLMLPDTPFIHPTVMFRKDAFYKAGMYCKSLINSQDMVLFNRMAKFGKYYNLSESLLKYRIVPSANSKGAKLSPRFHKILKKAIEDNTVSYDDTQYLKSIIGNRYSKSRLANYYLYIAKKYLWNNYQPQIARVNLLESLKHKYSIETIYLFFVSILPETVINWLYRMLKH
jgi:glycosyltransferase involved in cell wall biosynthesis